MSTQVVALTDRQRKALTLAARGLTDAQIARELFVHLDTAKLDLRHARLALGAVDRTSAVARAIFEGVITRNDVFGGQP